MAEKQERSPRAFEVSKDVGNAKNNSPECPIMNNAYVGCFLPVGVASIVLNQLAVEHLSYLSLVNQPGGPRCVHELCGRTTHSFGLSTPPVRGVFFAST
jgi:hypothetical protein